MSKRKHNNWRNNKTETPENRTTRLEKMRARMAVSRATETLQRRQIRLEKQRIRSAMLRATESSQHRQSRLEKQRIRSALSRAGETEEQRQARLQQNRTAVALARATESMQHREARLQQQRIRTALTRSMKRQVLSRPPETTTQNEIEAQRMMIYPNTKQNELTEANTIRLNDKFMYDKNSVDIKCTFMEHNKPFRSQCVNSSRFKCEFCNSLHFTQECPINTS